MSDSPATPPASDLLIRNGYVMTMDPAFGDLPCADVHIANGAIVAVGEGLSVPGALEIDGADSVVMPGLIDAHTHLWSSQMRGCFSGSGDGAYFKVRNQLADGYSPEDMYSGTRLGVTEAISSGITTVVDFCHNNRGSDFSGACLRALRDSGVRGRFLFGPSTRSPSNQTIDLAELERLHSCWNARTGGAPLSLGLAWRGPLGITSAARDEPIRPDPGVAKEEIGTARRLGLRASIHVSGHAAKAVFDSLHQNNLLGADVQLVHFSNASREDIRIAAGAGATLALTPLTELRVGYGITQLGDYLDGGMQVGVGIDSGALAGTSNPFAALKLFQLLESGRRGIELTITGRRLLELVTVEGARSIAMSSEIGSLTPGKRADVIMVRTRALNMGRFEDPAQLLVEATQPENVDTVIIDGRILKRQGEMQGIDTTQLVEAASTSITNIAQRTGFRLAPR